MGDGCGVNVTVAVGIAVFVGVFVAICIGVIADVGAEAKVVQLTMPMAVRIITYKMKRFAADFDGILRHTLYRFCFCA